MIPRSGLRAQATRIAALALAAPLILIAGSAGAATLTLEGDSWPKKAVYRAAAGETNELVVDRLRHPYLIFRDAGATITAPPFDPVQQLGCRDDQAVNALVCVYVGLVDVHLEDHDDTARVVGNSTSTVWAGSGNDKVSADSYCCATRLYGERGDDVLSAGGEGGQVADGGSGDDTLRIPGFAGHGTALGGPGNDILRFQSVIHASGDMAGGTGDDHITLQPGTRIRAFGDEGADVIDYAGTPAGPPQDYRGSTISGGAGPDTIFGGPFADSIAGDGGDDAIDAASDGVDTVVCGAGDDTVRADSSDSVAADCERLVIADVPAN